MKRCVEEAAIIVTNSTEPRVSCTITLTSPIMRETSEGGMKYPTTPRQLVLHLIHISVWNTLKKIIDADFFCLDFK